MRDNIIENKLWSELESDIAIRAPKKDSNFRLSGHWKTFLREQHGYKVYQVIGEWVRINLSIMYGHGGHGYVHEFIPNDEIWVSDCHFEGCGPDDVNCCKGAYIGKPFSDKFRDSTILHEIEENKYMKQGYDFNKAHQMALQKEKEAGFLDPYED
jgi:hypothetical protein